MVLRIDISGVTRDDRRCLGPLQLQVARGQFVGLVGPNGAGKTTLLKVAAGLVDPDSGRVQLSDRDLATLDADRIAQQAAFVLQQQRSDFPFRVREMVMLGTPMGIATQFWDNPQQVARADALLVEVGLHGFAERYIDTLSGGEYQRMLVARALMQDTPLLLLDEPTTALDLGHQVSLCRLIRQYQRDRQRTVLCALHDLNLAALFCERILLLQGGVVVADGPPQTVLTAERLSCVYGEDIEVGRRSDGTPFVLPGDAQRR